MRKILKERDRTVFAGENPPRRFYVAFECIFVRRNFSLSEDEYFIHKLIVLSYNKPSPVKLRKEPLILLKWAGSMFRNFFDALYS